MTKTGLICSVSFRTLLGAIEFARLRSIISSARKQGLNILQTLAAAPANLLLALNL